MPPILQDLLKIKGNTADILTFLYQFRMNAMAISRHNVTLRYGVRLDIDLALTTSKLNDLPYADHSLIDSVTAAISVLQKNKDTTALSSSYSKQLESLVNENKAILAAFHTQIDKSKALLAKQDEFFATTVVPTLAQQESNPDITRKLKGFKSELDAIKYENNKIISDFESNILRLQDLSRAVHKALAQLPESARGGIIMVEPARPTTRGERG